MSENSEKVNNFQKTTVSSNDAQNLNGEELNNAPTAPAESNETHQASAAQEEQQNNNNGNTNAVAAEQQTQGNTDGILNGNMLNQNDRNLTPNSVHAQITVQTASDVTNESLDRNNNVLENVNTVQNVRDNFVQSSFSPLTHDRNELVQNRHQNSFIFHNSPRNRSRQRIMQLQQEPNLRRIRRELRTIQHRMLRAQHYIRLPTARGTILRRYLLEALDHVDEVLRPTYEMLINLLRNI